jgi:hypothetical protein
MTAPRSESGFEQLLPCTTMDRDALYFRLSLIWLAMLVAGSAYVLLR